MQLLSTLSFFMSLILFSIIAKATEQHLFIKYAYSAKFSSYKSNLRFVLCALLTAGIASMMMTHRGFSFFPAHFVDPLTLTVALLNSSDNSFSAQHKSKYRSRFSLSHFDASRIFFVLAIAEKKAGIWPFCRATLVVCPGKNAYWKPGDVQRRVDLKVDSKLNRLRCCVSIREPDVCDVGVNSNSKLMLFCISEINFFLYFCDK